MFTGTNGPGERYSAVLPATSFAHTLGFQPLPAGFFAALVAMVVTYLALVEFGKRLFYGSPTAETVASRTFHRPHRHLRRRAARFSVGGRRTRSRGAES